MSNRTLPGPVLITGCSTGIGRLTARYLLRAGYRVCATARDPETVRELAAEGAHTCALDVTDEDSMAKAVAEVDHLYGRIGALVNNAGYGEYGPVENVPMDRVRAQFETNVFGAARMCQLVLPVMRRAGGGRIITMSSVGGRMTFPGGGFYNASKYAIESLSDALRFEAAPFGVSVSVIEPNLIRDTRFEDHVGASLDRNTDREGPYRGLVRAIQDQMNRCFDGKQMSSPPELVASTVHRALRSRRPRSRYVVSMSGKLILASQRLVPDLSMDTILRRQFGLTRSGVYNGKYARPE
ncbi:SDR family NAD(P)-dependent oxidoreductase [Saccharomonospora piscinae]|uniref:SDR family NAD(P)-dependent oxidoreductase n=1 Tax=Saccharomonospora piscinae TaxID=687388 RepID=UPI001ABE6F56|nr:SDR family NAD(P)-dependent oxidoreductase [Saccharomonospora piscinae]